MINHPKRVFKATLQLLFTLLIMLSSAAFARSESEIKAIYLYNFIKFITWPAEQADTDFNICIYGNNPFGTHIDKLQSLTVRQRAINISYPNRGDLQSCDVLFITDSEEKFSAEILRKLTRQPILTVSDIDGFINTGGMIGFVKLGNVVKFDINLEQARSSELEISSKLLKLANEVKQ